MESKKIEPKIEMSALELKVLKLDLKGKFFPPEQTDEEIKALHDLINKADDLLLGLNAIDELDRYQNLSVLQWYYDKYKEQQAGENNQ